VISLRSTPAPTPPFSIPTTPGPPTSTLFPYPTLFRSVATKTLTGTTAGAVTLKGTSGTVAAGALLTFTVTHAAADHIDLTGSTRSEEHTSALQSHFTIEDLHLHVKKYEPDATLVVNFA